MIHSDFELTGQFQNSRILVRRSSLKSNLHTPSRLILDNSSCLDIRFRPTNVLLEPQQFHGEVDVILEVILGVKLELGRVTLVLFDVQPDRSAAATGAGQTDDDSAAVVKGDVESLVLADAAVEICVGEIIGLDHLSAVNG